MRSLWRGIMHVLITIYGLFKIKRGWEKEYHRSDSFNGNITHNKVHSE